MTMESDVLLTSLAALAFGAAWFWVGFASGTAREKSRKDAMEVGHVTYIPEANAECLDVDKHHFCLRTRCVREFRIIHSRFRIIRGGRDDAKVRR